LIYSKRFSDKSNRSKLGNKLLKVSTSSICVIEHDCKESCVNFLNIKLLLFEIFDKFDKSNKRNDKRFRFGNSKSICINVFDVNFDVRRVVDRTNSSK
jgi:hypothetical protein